MCFLQNVETNPGQKREHVRNKNKYKIELHSTREAIASKNYWPLQDTSHLLIYEAPLRSIDRSHLNDIQARTTIYRVDFY